jgi:hypothetical protein
MWDLWRTKWRWDRFSPSTSDFPCQSSFHQFLRNHHHLSFGAGIIGQFCPQYQTDQGYQYTQFHPINKKILSKPSLPAFLSFFLILMCYLLLTSILPDTRPSASSLGFRVHMRDMTDRSQGFSLTSLAIHHVKINLSSLFGHCTSSAVEAVS